MDSNIKNIHWNRETSIKTGGKTSRIDPVLRLETLDIDMCCSCHISSCNLLPTQNHRISSEKRNLLKTLIESSKFATCLLCGTFGRIYLAGGKTKKWLGWNGIKRAETKKAFQPKKLLFRSKAPNRLACNAMPRNHSKYHCTKPSALQLAGIKSLQWVVTHNNLLRRSAL